MFEIWVNLLSFFEMHIMSIENPLKRKVVSSIVGNQVPFLVMNALGVIL